MSLSDLCRRDFLHGMAGALAALAMPRTGAFASGNRLPFRFGDARDWFFQKRFGMFVHWGLYSINGWHEQHQWRGRIPRAEYAALASQWNPVKFDPDALLDLMQAGGMKYLCLTTKHHDGFCLWDTKATAFNTMNTPYGKDIVAMLAKACQPRGVPLCLYYSIVDWNHPNYPNEGRHHELPPQPGDHPDWAAYLEFLKTQVRELCSNYGQIHGFWWDMNVPKTVDRSINDTIRRLQPAAVINNRGFDEGDFGTPERDYDKDADKEAVFERPVEACQSVGAESWGFRKDEDYFGDRLLERSIDSYLARNANYLLNVGPRADGTVPPEAEGIVRRIGAWYRSIAESVENVRPAPGLTANPNVLLTRRENTVYVHLHREPASDGVKLGPIAIAPRRATLLNTGAPVEFAVDLLPSEHAAHRPSLHLRHLPVNEMANTVLVVKLEFDRPPDAAPGNANGADDGILVR